MDYSFQIKIFCFLLLNITCFTDTRKRKFKSGHHHRRDTNTSDVLCKLDGRRLRGCEKVDLEDYSMSFLERKFNNTRLGGRWKPRNCKAAKRVAIIIPFRDRETHLRKLLYNLIPKLRRQKVDYTFYVVEQAPGDHFNRGLVKNIGFVEARKQAEYDCYIFNDVDTIIESDYNFYTCKPGVIFQIATRYKIFGYRFMYPSFVGGIVGVTAELFQRVNGYTNFLFIWGAEDDDLWRRVKDKGGTVERNPLDEGLVATLSHKSTLDIDACYHQYYEIKPFSERDGLNTLNYSCTITKKKLFTHVYAEINEFHYIKMLNGYQRERSASFKTFAETQYPGVCERKDVFQYFKPQRVCPVKIPLKRQSDKNDDIYLQLRSKPGGSTSYKRVAIIVPFQCHHKQLKYVTDTIIPIFHHQNIVPTFYVIKLEQGSSFNRGLLNNIGFLEAFKQEEEQNEKYERFGFLNLKTMFHDNCTSKLHRQSLMYELKRPVFSRRKHGYVLNTYKCVFFAFHRMVFMGLNGYSNFYFNSELEHKDLYRRIKSCLYEAKNIGDMFRPYKQRADKKSLAIYNRIVPYAHKDGLNTVRYTIVRKQRRKSFTFINVRIDESYYIKLFQRYTNEGLKSENLERTFGSLNKNINLTAFRDLFLVHLFR